MRARPAVVALLLAACASGGPPDAFTDREELRACGDERCLRDAIAAGEGAELEVVQSTVEGDEIRQYVRHLPGDGIEIFADATDDGRGWTHLRCGALSPTTLDGVDCEEAAS